MLRNQATALIEHEHITTTVARARELRPFVERLITVAKRGTAAGGAATAALNARRQVMQDIQDRAVVGKLFDTIAPRFEGRAGGYTRLLRLGFRKGDAAEIAQVELIGSEFNPRAQAEAEAAGAAEPEAKGVGGRLRAAAQRLRGKKAESGGESSEEKTAKPAKASKPAKTRSRAKAAGKTAKQSGDE